MDIVLSGLLFFIVPIMSGAIWFIIPTSTIYPIVAKIKRGKWECPYSWIDLLTLFALDAIWYLGIQTDYNQRGWGRLTDIVLFGFLFGAAQLVRMPIILRRPELKGKAAAATLIVLSLLSTIFTWGIVIDKCND